MDWFGKKEPEWEILSVERDISGTRVEAKHLKTAHVIRLLRDLDYGAHAN